jgi:hypothetical protein
MLDVFSRAKTVRDEFTAKLAKPNEIGEVKKD